MVFWYKENNKTKRSHSPPASNLALSTHVERSINLEEFAPQKMADNLLTEWQTINSAELSVYRENKTGKERTVVRDLESRSKSALGRSGLTSVLERVADGANAMGTEKDEDMAGEEGPNSVRRLTCSKLKCYTTLIRRETKVPQKEVSHQKYFYAFIDHCNYFQGYRIPLSL